jgi:hypothetical protein
MPIKKNAKNSKNGQRLGLFQVQFDQMEVEPY